MFVPKLDPGDAVSLSKKRFWNSRSNSRKGLVADFIGAVSPGDNLRDIACAGFHVALLHKLGEDLLEVRQPHQLAQPAHRIVGDDAALIDHDYVLADLLHYFQHV